MNLSKLHTGPGWSLGGRALAVAAASLAATAGPAAGAGITRFHAAVSVGDSFSLRALPRI